MQHTNTAAIQASQEEPKTLLISNSLILIVYWLCKEYVFDDHYFCNTDIPWFYVIAAGIYLYASNLLFSFKESDYYFRWVYLERPLDSTLKLWFPYFLRILMRLPSQVMLLEMTATQGKKATRFQHCQYTFKFQ